MSDKQGTQSSGDDSDDDTESGSNTDSDSDNNDDQRSTDGDQSSSRSDQVQNNDDSDQSQDSSSDDNGRDSNSQDQNDSQDQSSPSSGGDGDGFEPLPVMDLKNQPLISGDSRNDIVQALQSALMVLGYDVGSSGVNGNFDDATEQAVKNFQQDSKDWKGNPLNADGKVEELTCDALNRNLVGSWFDSYQTPVELTNDVVFVTITKQALKGSLGVEYSSGN